MTDRHAGEIRLRCARAGSWRGLWRATRWWAGVAFLGFAGSAIGWVNLIAAAIRGEPLGSPARTGEWLFAGTGSLLVVLSLTMEVGPWLSARYGRPVRLGPAGVTYFGHVRVPWSRFQGIEVVRGEDGRPELAGLASGAASLSSRLTPYVISADRLSLGDLDEAGDGRPPGHDVLDAVRRWQRPADGG